MTAQPDGVAGALDRAELLQHPGAVFVFDPKRSPRRVERLASNTNVEMVSPVRTIAAKWSPEPVVRPASCAIWPPRTEELLATLPDRLERLGSEAAA